jgi:integrase
VPKLTARSVETKREPGRYGDGDGLALVITNVGHKKWVFRYQVAGRRRDMGLGKYPVVSLAMARERAAAARRTIVDGKDPIATRRAGRSVKPVPAFREMAAEVIALEQAKSTNEKVRYQWVHLLGPAYCASILDKMVDQITTSDVERVLRAVWTAKPETARKLHRRIRRVFEHVRIRLRDNHGISMPNNPARWEDLKALGFTAPRKLSRGPQPSLSYLEISQIMAVLRARETMTARALELLILTAVRTDAVRRATWAEFDLDASVWTIPIDHLKDKRTRNEPFRVPLATQVASLLRPLRAKRVSNFVFPGPDGQKPMSNMGMSSVLKTINRDENCRPRWADPRDGRPIVPHGFRSTFRSWAEDETHFPRSLIEQAMGHQVGTEVERAYLRTDALEKRRVLMQAWADYVLCGP